MSDFDKVIVILRDGKQVSLKEWQKIYDLPLKSTQIGRYYSYMEPKFQENIKDYGELIVNELLVRVMDQYREDVGEPVDVNSFNRNMQKQIELGKSGFRTATYSPHVVMKMARVIHGGFAVDFDTLSKDDTIKKVKILLQSAKKLNIKIRVGYKEYLAKNQTFIHCDVGPEFYAKEKPWHKLFHPIAWEKATDNINMCW